VYPYRPQAIKIFRERFKGTRTERRQWRMKRGRKSSEQACNANGNEAGQAL
jgi:hypothetical protein